MLKLKPIVASMMLLGLAAPAFADTLSAATQMQIDSMKAQLGKMEAVMNQNNLTGYEQPNDWTSRITLSGMANINAYASNTTPVFGARGVGGNSTNIDVNNANVLVDALVNDWTKVHINLFYSANQTTAFTNLDATGTSQPTLDEAYVTIANFSESPLFFRAGREYVPFGVYNRYPIVINPTQLLSQTQATAAQAGFVLPIGFYGSLYGFRGLPKSGDVTLAGFPTTNRARVNNWGADLGYAYSDNNYNAKLDVGYLYNMDDVQYVSQNPLFGTTGYFQQVGAVAASFDGSAWNFDAALRYVTALRAFGALNVNAVTGGGLSSHGAKPNAVGAELGYTFPVVAHSTRFGLGYQQTSKSPSKATTIGLPTSVGLYGLPKNRVYGNYVVNVSKWTDIGLEVYHDKDYSKGNGGTGSSATVGVLQLGVKFA